MKFQFTQDQLSLLLKESFTFRQIVAEKLSSDPIRDKVEEIVALSPSKVSAVKSVREVLSGVNKPSIKELEESFPEIDFGDFSKGNAQLGLADTKHIVELFLGE